MSRLGVALSYLLIWPPVAIVSVLSIFGILALMEWLGLAIRYEWMSWPIGLLPPFLCGAWCYRALGTYLQARRQPGAPYIGHLRRSAALYLIALVLGTVIAWNISDKGFGLVAPVFVWPLLATLGGILGDRLIPIPRPSIPRGEP